MSGDVQDQAIQVSIKAAEISFNLMRLLIRKIVSNRKTNSASLKEGKQSLRSLNRQGKQLEQVEIPDKDLKQLRRDLRKHSVDYAIMREKGSSNYHVYFKSQDVDRIYTALERCVASFDKTTVKKRPIREQLENARKVAAERAASRASSQTIEQKMVRDKVLSH